MPHAKSDTPADKPYHHGNLIEALLSATVALIEEGGVDQVSVREVARRAGVSPGAPFRHFKSKTALLTAVAEQAMGRLVEAVSYTVSGVDEDDPMAGIEAIGRAYLGWALSNPTHFQIISSRSVIDFGGSESLQRDNEAIRQRMIGLLTRARDLGHISSATDLDHVVLASRALVYGLARMAIDGHFPEWHVAEPPGHAANQALRLFIASVTTPRAAAR